jgi:gliding motility-associated-like protein
MHKQYFLTKVFPVLFVFALNLSIAYSSFGQTFGRKNTNEQAQKHALKWKTNPLDHAVFVENNGQFNADVNTGDKVLYEAQLGEVRAYFTSRGVVYRYDRMNNELGAISSEYASTIWDKANAEVSVVAEHQQDYYYTYPKGKNDIIKASVFKKVTYRNIYPGIDIVYTFPSGKEGIKYALILHPGADISLAKLKYSNSKEAHIDSSGNVLINTGIGAFTDHAPISYNENGKSISSSYRLNGTEESFRINESYDRSATIIIDPWTTNPLFNGAYNKAYDLDFDDKGNVYVYGSYNPFQLVKMNSAGMVQWTFNASMIDGVIYGDFAVDRTTGTSYIVEGANKTGARVLKVNTAGVLKATFAGDTNMNEMWRAVYDPCNHMIVIGAGGTNSDYQACTIDTNMTSLNVVNVLGASAPGHSMVFTAIDPLGTSCYMATSKSAVVDTANFHNVVLKMPLPALAPTTYIKPDGFKFVELASVNYVGPGVGTTNGMNGMAASTNWLYMCDGSTLEQVSKNTGAINNSISVSSTAFSWGGLDADICDNVYLGNKSSVYIYSSSLVPIDTISLSNTVYDVVLGPNEQTLYACGDGFVSAFNVASSLTATKIVTPAICGCNGTAKAILKACGSVDTSGLTYSWSNGQTTATATNLCAGTYTVSIIASCSIIYIDTVTVSSHFISINTPSPTICTGSNGVSLTVNGASSYTWKPSAGLSITTGSSVIADPASTTTYTVYGVSGTCNDSVIVVVKVNPTPTITVTGPASPVCPNIATPITVSGASGYAWSPAGTLSCSSCSSVTATVAITTTFTVVGITNGCTDTNKVTVTVLPTPTITIATTPTGCSTKNGTATATVSGTGPYTYSWTPSGGTTTSATGLGAGSYVISVTDTNGCVAKQACIIKITASPTVTAKDSVASCDSANGKAIATVTGGTPPFKYLWNPGAGTNSTYTNIGAGIYTVTVTDSNGCTSKASTILEDTGATISFSARNNVSCFGGSNGGATVILTGGTAPYTYLWSKGSSTSSVNNLAIGQYTVTVTDKNGCKLIDTINIHQPAKLTGTIPAKNVIKVSCFNGSDGKVWVSPAGGTAPYTYLWSDGQTGDTAIGVKSITYTVTITDNNGCTAQVSDSVGEPPKLVANASNSSATCKNNGIASATAIGGTPGYTYNWGAFGNGSSIYDLYKGTYTVVVTDSHGCTDTTTTTVDTVGQTATIKASKNVSCFGGSNGGATVSVIGGDTSLYSYAWAPTGGSNATADNLAPGVYTITVTYVANLCTVIVNDTITQPPVLSTVIADSIRCGVAVTCYDTTTGGTPSYTYNWSPSGGTNAIASFPSAGSFTLTVTDANNCTVTKTVVIPGTYPVANFKPTPDTISPGDSIEFVNLSSGANTWYWTFGDGNSSIDSMPYHIYTIGGSYVVYLKVTSKFGCTDSISGTIYVTESIEVPNIFTPNGDGINDVFHVNARGMANYRIDIYDRWGLLIFEGIGPGNDWTGRTMSGELASVGTYYYIITASDNNGKSFNQKGYLELIR